MSADSKFAESIARLEHKVDVLMSLVTHLIIKNRIVDSEKFLQSVLQHEQVGSPQHRCFLCDVPVEYYADPVDSVVVRKCGCKTGKIALDLKMFAPPISGNIRKENEDAIQRRNDQEEHKR